MLLQMKRGGVEGLPWEAVCGKHGGRSVRWRGAAWGGAVLPSPWKCWRQRGQVGAAAEAAAEAGAGGMSAAARSHFIIIIIFVIILLCWDGAQGLAQAWQVLSRVTPWTPETPGFRKSGLGPRQSPRPLSFSEHRPLPQALGDRLLALAP